MNDHSSPMLLSPSDPPPVRIVNPHGVSPFLLIGDHAGNVVPASLGSLGLADEELSRHIAWDIGVAGLGERLSADLDAVFISQRYSRLVIDCNRHPQAIDAMPAESDGVSVPANRNLSADQRDTREREIHAPYHAAISAELARRDKGGQRTILVSLHSFTPAMQGVSRPWQIGVLHAGGDVSFALLLLELLQAGGTLTVGDNQPYAMDEIDYTVPRHAIESHRKYVELELRQDRLGAAPEQAAWSRSLAPLFARAAAAQAG